MPKSSPDSAPRKALCSGDYSCQFAAHGSPVHRMGAGWKLALGLMLTALAAGVRTPGTLCP